MKKLILSLLFLIFLTGCSWDRGIILFNSEPITKENVMNSSNKIFRPGQRVYYLFVAPKEMENKYIRVQVFKIEDKTSWGGADILRTNDYRLMKDEKYYHMDYVTLYKTGRYVLQVFSIDDLQHPLSVNDFYIK